MIRSLRYKYVFLKLNDTEINETSKKLVKTCIFLLKKSKKVKNWGFLLIIYEKNKNFTF